MLHSVAQFGIKCRESNGGGEIDIGFNEGDDFRTRNLGRDHQYVLIISEAGVVDEDEEAHHGAGDEFFASSGGGDGGLDFGQEAPLLGDDCGGISCHH